MNFQRFRIPRAAQEPELAAHLLPESRELRRADWVQERILGSPTPSLRERTEWGCSGPEDNPQELGCTGRVNPRRLGTNPLPGAHTHRSAGDPSNPAVLPAAQPETRPAALVPAALLDSSAFQHPRAKTEKWAKRRLRSGNCHQGSRISHGPTDPALGGVREGAESVSWSPLRLLGRHCGEDSPLGWPAPDGLVWCSRLQAGETVSSQKGAGSGRGAAQGGPEFA